MKVTSNPLRSSHLPGFKLTLLLQARGANVTNPIAMGRITQHDCCPFPIEILCSLLSYAQRHAQD
jgi:hypothetical protein